MNNALSFDSTKGWQKKQVQVCESSASMCIFITDLSHRLRVNLRIGRVVGNGLRIWRWADGKGDVHSMSD